MQNNCELVSNLGPCGVTFISELDWLWNNQVENRSPLPLHGNVGTPTVCAMIEEATLSPNAHIEVEVGPKTSIKARSNNPVF